MKWNWRVSRVKETNWEFFSKNMTVRAKYCQQIVILHRALQILS